MISSTGVHSPSSGRCRLPHGYFSSVLIVNVYQLHNAAMEFRHKLLFLAIVVAICFVIWLGIRSY
jgi:hypothetical protein